MQIFKRKLLYLGGFDPRGAPFYYRLCVQQVRALTGAASATVTDPRRRDGNVHWQVEGQDENGGGRYRTDVEFLMWDDIVRRHWIRGSGALLRQGARAYGWFARKADWRLSRSVPMGSRVTFVYPGASLLLAPLLAMILLGSLGSLVLPAWTAFPMAMALGMAVTPGLLRRIHSLWLLRFIIFNDLLARDAAGDALARRLETFVDRIDATLDEEEWDEILFLTHSNGSILSIPIMASLLARRGGVLPDRFSMVTMGSSIQMIACRRDAAHYGAMLDVVAAGRFRWLDIGSLTDGACVPLVDPCLGRPITRPAGLVQVSPRWFRYSDPATYQAQRRDKYETHFNYLRRLDTPSPLDYVGIACGARMLPASIAAFQAENGASNGRHAPVCPAHV